MNVTDSYDAFQYKNCFKFYFIFLSTVDTVDWKRTEAAILLK